MKQLYDTAHRATIRQIEQEEDQRQRLEQLRQRFGTPAHSRFWESIRPVDLDEPAPETEIGAGELREHLGTMLQREELGSWLRFEGLGHLADSEPGDTPLPGVVVVETARAELGSCASGGLWCLVESE